MSDETRSGTAGDVAAVAAKSRAASRRPAPKPAVFQA